MWTFSEFKPVVSLLLIDHPWLLPSHLISLLNQAGGWDYYYIIQEENFHDYVDLQEDQGVIL